MTAAISVREIGEIAGFLAGLAGGISGILLAVPLFHLLRAREAIEDLERNIDMTDPGSDQYAELRVALDDLRLHVRRRRRTARRIGIAGIGFLVVGMIFVLIQGTALWLAQGAA